MKKAILIYILTLTAITVLSQKWEQTIGEPDNYEASRRVMEHYDKGYLISAQNDQQAWLVKTDINGNVLWDKTFGIDPNKVITEKTLYDDQGNMYLFGGMLQEVEPLWPFVIKLNACGEPLWCRQLYFDEYEDGAFYDAIMLDNGDFLALASMPDEEQHDKIFLVCISRDGDYKWKKSYASKDNYPFFGNRLGSRVQFFDDIYIISGYVYSPHPSNPNVYSIRPMFIGIDTLFNEQWVLEFGLVDNMKGKALTSIPINDSLFMGVGRYRYGGNHMDAWAMYYNDQGEQTGYAVITNEQLGNEVGESTFYEVERMNDSIYLATAGFYSLELDEPAIGEIVFDTTGKVYDYEIRIESQASTYLTKTFDDKYTIACSYQYLDFSYDVYFYKINENLEHDTVYPGNYTYDSLCTELPIQSGTINLAGCDIITSLKEIPWLEDYNKQEKSIKVKVYPNPVVGGEVTFEFQNTSLFSDMTLKCFDVYGQEVYAEKVYQHQGESRVNIQNWQSGIYIVLIYSSGQVVGQGKFVVQ